MSLTSMTSTFSFTNTSPMEGVTVAPTDLKPITMYAKTKDEATEVNLKNKTGPTSQRELLSYECMPIKTVATKNKVVNPGKVQEGVQFVVRLDEILRTTNDDGSIVIDEPIVMYLTVRFPLSSNVLAEHIETIFKRLNGACMREDGTYRFDDLMVSALAPIAD